MLRPFFARGTQSTSVVLLPRPLCVEMIRISTRKKEIHTELREKQIEMMSKRSKIAASKCHALFAVQFMKPLHPSTAIYEFLKIIRLLQNPHPNSQPFRRKQMQRRNISNESRVCAVKQRQSTKTPLPLLPEHILIFPTTTYTCTREKERRGQLREKVPSEGMTAGTYGSSR